MGNLKDKITFSELSLAMKCAAIGGMVMFGILIIGTITSIVEIILGV